MGKAPAFQLYASDFKMDTEDWTVTETGIYIRLLMNQWVNKELPKEPARLARIAGCDVRTFKKNWKDTIAKKFVPTAQGGLQNYRLEKTRKEREEFIKKQAESGRSGGLKTQKNRRKTSSDPSSQNQALQSSSSSSSLNLKPFLSQASLKLADLFMGCIIKENPKSKIRTITKKEWETQGKKWAEDIDKIIRIDKRSEKDIEDVIKFATSDPFWKSNILSAVKLRKQFEQLYLKMQQPKKENLTPAQIRAREWGAV